MSDGNREQLFDRWAEHYDCSVAGTGHPFPFGGYRQILDEVVRQAEAERGMSVLDLGIGTGQLASRFDELGCSLSGIDLSPEMLAKARTRLPGAVLVRADLLGEWAPDLGRRFDRVVSAYVFHEFDLETKVALLQRLARSHLRTTGRIIIGDISFPTAEAREDARARWRDRWDEEEHYWAADEAIVACSRGGLRATYRQVSSCGGVFLLLRPAQ